MVALSHLALQNEAEIGSMTRALYSCKVSSGLFGMLWDGHRLGWHGACAGEHNPLH